MVSAWRYRNTQEEICPTEELGPPHDPMNALWAVSPRTAGIWYMFVEWMSYLSFIREGIFQACGLVKPGLVLPGWISTGKVVARLALKSRYNHILQEKPPLLSTPQRILYHTLWPGYLRRFFLLKQGLHGRPSLHTEMGLTPRGSRKTKLKDI